MCGKDAACAKEKKGRSQRKEKIAAQTDDKSERPLPAEGEEEGWRDGLPGSAWGRQAVNKLQRRVKRHGGRYHRPGRPDGELDGRHAGGGGATGGGEGGVAAASGRGAEDEFMKALAVWGLPGEARSQDHMG